MQKVGGQRLEDYAGALWYDLRDARYDALNNNKERIRTGKKREIPNDLKKENNSIENSLFLKKLNDKKIEDTKNIVSKVKMIHC